MKDFENDLIYYPNPDPIEEPRFILNSVEELENQQNTALSAMERSAWYIIQTPLIMLS